MKFCCKTLEEAKEKWPIGKRINDENKIVEISLYYYNEKDLKILRKTYPDLVIVDDCKAIGYIKSYKYPATEGYIYDGEYFYPAEQTWDGWIPIKR